MTAIEPWSGHYEVMGPIWVSGNHGTVIYDSLCYVVNVHNVTAWLCYSGPGGHTMFQ